MNLPERVTRIQEMKRSGEKIACLTAYDASFSRLLEQEGVDVVLVGDSLGMVLQGAGDTLKVSMDDMVYHTRLAAAGLKHTLLAADMPYRSYTDAATAVDNARRLVEAGAQMVKLEGGRGILDQVLALRDAGIPVCGHLGLQPQSVREYGGYKVQGRAPGDASRIIEDARLLAEAGVKMIVLECIPHRLASRITGGIDVPAIGIGAGLDCDGQILVLYDVIGISSYIPKMANDFLQAGGSIRGAVRAYVEAVKSRTFPTLEQSFE